MRVDKFLKLSRILKRRVIACQMADGGRVTVNGRVAKPSTTLKPDDIMAIRFGENVLTIKVLITDEKLAKRGNIEMYKTIT